MEDIGQERRKFPRTPLELLVRYKILSSPEQAEAETKNISGGGVCLVTREKMEPGTYLAMEIKFPHSKGPILAGGRVIWSSDSRFGPSPAGHPRFDNGIQFVQIREADRLHIIEHVKSELKKLKPEGWQVGLVTDMPK
ncbi:MAG: PilZ domain-containing protein [Candidatus Omnitrophica bacterium]|nr:PilZ domain-containing protein [Candidatus Omnitrophota bacterium]